MIQMSNFMKILSVGAELFHADEETKLLVVSLNCATAPKIDGGRNLAHPLKVKKLVLRPFLCVSFPAFYNNNYVFPTNAHYLLHKVFLPTCFGPKNHHQGIVYIALMMVLGTETCRQEL